MVVYEPGGVDEGFGQAYGHHPSQMVVTRSRYPELRSTTVFAQGADGHGRRAGREVLHQLPHFGIFQPVITVPPLGHDRQKTAGYQQGKVLAGCGWGDSHGPGQLPRTESLATEQSHAHFRPRRLAQQSAQGRQVDIDRHAPRLREGRFGPDRNVLRITRRRGGMAARAEVEVRIFLSRANSSNWTALPPMEDPVHG